MTDDIESQAFQMRVLETLKAGKFQESLRAVMRLKMIEKLQGQPMKQRNIGDLSLKQKLVFSMFYNFLESQQMPMTQSILLPELGTESGLLSDKEIAEILKHKSPQFEKFLNTTQKSAAAGSTKAETLAELLVGNYLSLRHETYESST